MKNSRYQKLVEDGIAPIAPSLIPKERLQLYVATVADMRADHEFPPNLQAYVKSKEFALPSLEPWCVLVLDLEEQEYMCLQFRTQKDAEAHIAKMGSISNRFVVLPMQDLLVPKSKSVEVDL